MRVSNLIKSQTAFCILIFISVHAFSQQSMPWFGNHNLLSGYETNVEGEILPYYSSSPQFATDALLTRCTDGKKIITWKTAPAPKQLNDKYYYFYWLSGHSSGTSTTDSKFDLKINGVVYLTFITPINKIAPFYWSFSGKDSVAVVFEATKTDIHKDVFGNMYLCVPKSLLRPGEPLELSICGHNENSNNWFMVFRYSYSEKLRIIPTPLLVKTVNGIKQLLAVSADHIYPQEKTIQITINNKSTNFPVNIGYNYFEIPIDTVIIPTRLSIVTKIGKEFVHKYELMQMPVHRREVDIIHHSHNDIGYSHVQEDVIKIQYKNLIDALDMIDSTNNYPEGSRFIWNEETLWPVEYFIKNAGSNNIKRLIDAIQNKSIVLSGFYVGVMTGLCSAEELNWITEYAVYLRKTYNIPLISAMLSDIPGLSWSITDALYKNGFRYLSNGPNYNENHPDNGDRIGSTLRDLGDKPFYWKTTTGKGKILVWTAGRGYCAFHQIPDGDLSVKIKDKLISYLNELDTSEYPYDMVQLRYTIKSDNGPVDKNLSEFVQNWNSKYISPKLCISGVNNMMQKFEQKYGNRLPVYAGDFTPYWEDGAYSTAYEEGETRVLSDYISQLEKLSAIFPEKKVDQSWFYEARKNIVMFHEHTWGAWNSISSPDDAFAVNQWNYKKAFIDSSQKYVSKIESVLLSPAKDVSKLEVYNTLDHIRSGYVEIKLPDGKEKSLLVDENGNTVYLQSLSDGNQCFVAENIPANGYKTYRLINANEGIIAEAVEHRYAIDSNTGAIKSFIQFRKEFVNAKTFTGLGQMLYVKGLNPALLSTTKVKSIKITDRGIIKTTIRIDCELEGSISLTYYINLFEYLNYIELNICFDKKAVREKEAMHIAFPFNITNSVNRIGISDTCYIPGTGQIPGANHDFYSVQRWIDVCGDGYGVTMSSPQGALFEIGSMTNEQPTNQGYKAWKDSQPPSSTLFLYILNNYWFTNFKADQSGAIQFDCYLKFHKQFDLIEANSFGAETHTPLLSCWK